MCVILLCNWAKWSLFWLGPSASSVSRMPTWKEVAIISEVDYAPQFSRDGRWGGFLRNERTNLLLNGGQLFCIEQLRDADYSEIILNSSFTSKIQDTLVDICWITCSKGDKRQTFPLNIILIHYNLNHNDTRAQTGRNMAMLISCKAARIFLYMSFLWVLHADLNRAPSFAHQ